MLIFTLYTYKYHKIYIVCSYTIIKDRKKPQTQRPRNHKFVCGACLCIGKIFRKMIKKSSCISTETFLPAGASPPGGDDGNRTRVRKSIRMNFYECSLLLTFPRIIGNKHPIMLSSLQYTLETQALPQCVHR